MSAPEAPILPPELRRALPRHVAPPGLRRRVAYLVAQHAQAAGQSAAPAQPLPVWQRARLPAAAFACGVLLTALAWTGLVAWDKEQAMAQQLVEGHVRSLMSAHLTDVAASDPHTVTSWLAGKLDHAPTVVDAGDPAFVLAGARLDWLQGRSVVALVYQRRAHAISLFMWPQAGSRLAPEASSQQGYQLVHWRDGGLAYAAVSDLNAAELQSFARLMATRLAARAPAG